MNRALFLSVAVVVFSLDQFTKHLAWRTLDGFVSMPVVAGFFYLTRTTNTGGAFGLFPSSAVMLACIAAVAIFCIVWYVARTRWPLTRVQGVGLALALGGAAGNLIDRARLGFVVDFLDFRLGRFAWPVFNLADSAICIGVGLLALSLLLQRHTSTEVAGTIRSIN
jgi:signal peptidase II